MEPLGFLPTPWSVHPSEYANLAGPGHCRQWGAASLSKLPFGPCISEWICSLGVFVRNRSHVGRRLRQRFPSLSLHTSVLWTSLSSTHLPLGLGDRWSFSCVDFFPQPAGARNNHIGRSGVVALPLSSTMSTLLSQLATTSGFHCNTFG